MNIVILSRNRDSYSTRRLRAAAIKCGHTARVADTLDHAIFLEGGNPTVFYRGRPIRPPDAIVPRIGTSITQFGTSLVRQFEQMGVFCLNSSHAIAVSRDKLRAMQVLSRHEIGIPATAFVHSRMDVLAAIKKVGGAPVIVKLLEGTQGVGVILAESVKVAEAIIETLQASNQQVLIQRFVKESRGRDLRAFVVGGRVVASMRRVAVGDEFRSNVHRGGRTERVQLEPDCERTAIRAAQLMGLHVAGVDMLEAEDGPLVLEVNSSPGLEGIEKTTGVDVAAAVVQHLEEQVQFPEVDLKERLNIGSEYQVAELTVHAMPELEHRLLHETQLSDHRVRVLSLRRNGVEMSNPEGSTRILPGDTLLCYGPRLALRSLLPERRPDREPSNSSLG